jgi:hypothetical protein
MVADLVVVGALELLVVVFFTLLLLGREATQLAQTLGRDTIHTAFLLHASRWNTARWHNASFLRRRQFRETKTTNMHRLITVAANSLT